MMKVFEMILGEDAEDYGLTAISLVERPAIEENWVALSKDMVMLKTANEEKRLLVGAALVPGKYIDRVEGEEAYKIVFPEDTIRMAAQRYLIDGLQSASTIEHQGELVKGVHLVESWIVEDSDKDKSNVYGLTYPKGTWVVMLKIQDDDIWNEYVKTGKVKGFSIEGRFIHRLKTQLSAERTPEDIAKQIKDLLDGMVEEK